MDEIALIKWKKEEEQKIATNNKYMAKYTLRKLCLDTVFGYRGLIDSRPLENIPWTLKIDLIQLAIKRFKKCVDPSEDLICCFLATLMNSEIISLRLPALKSSPPLKNNSVKSLLSAGKAPLGPKPNIQKLMEAIGAKCSGLRLLHVCVQVASGEQNLLTEDSHLGGSFFRALPRLTSLQVVQISTWYQCGDWALQQFGMHAPNLVVLEVELSLDVSSVGFEALSKLRHLRQFLFGESLYGLEWEHEKKLLLLSSRILPQLRVAGRCFDILLDIDVLYGADVFEHSTGYHDEMVQEKIAVLSLENLVLGRDVHPYENLQMPELKSLSLWFPNNEDVLPLCERFSNISQLGIHSCEEHGHEEMIKKVLQSLGQQLRLLLLDEVSQTPSLAEILRFCPRLERFRLCSYFHNFSLDDGASNEWPERSFSCMEEVVLQVNNIPCGFIMQLLKSAHLLKKLTICFNSMTNGEVDELIQLVRGKQNLQNIMLVELWHPISLEDHPPSADKEHIDLLLKTVKWACPQMKMILK